MARILIIEDEESVRLAIRRMVEWAGHDAVEAVDGDHGIRLQRIKPSDLIISDILMPGKNGTDTITEIIHTYPETPIIAMSGSRWRENTDFPEIAKNFGVRVIVDKPFEMAELLSAVQNCLELSTQLQPA